MTNPAVRVWSAFAAHIAHLLSFRHDGRGLPQLGNPLLIVLVGLKLAFAYLVIRVVIPEVGEVNGFLKSLLATAALYCFALATRRFYAFSGYLLLWLGVDVGLVGLSLLVDKIPEAFITTCYAWGLIAFITLLFRADLNNEKNTS